MDASLPSPVLMYAGYLLLLNFADWFKNKTGFHTKPALYTIPALGAVTSIALFIAGIIYGNQNQLFVLGPAWTPLVMMYIVLEFIFKKNKTGFDYLLRAPSFLPLLVMPYLIPIAVIWFWSKAFKVLFQALDADPAMCENIREVPFLRDLDSYYFKS